jgi:hypothetical protein
MLKIFDFIFSGCWHKWKILHTAHIKSDMKAPPDGYAYICQCEKCGTPKRFDLI